MNFRSHGHHHGDSEVAPHLKNEVEETISASSVDIVRGSATALRDDILNRLLLKGWPPEVEIDPTSKISVTSLRERVGLCLQTGNMARMYADLLKLQTLYLRETIDAGILIVPTYRAAKKMGDNVANYERLIRELQIFERAIYVPIFVMGVDI